MHNVKGLPQRNANQCHPETYKNGIVVGVFDLCRAELMLTRSATISPTRQVNSMTGIEWPGGLEY